MTSKLKEELFYKYKSGISNLFIITGNITDYPVPNKLFKEYLKELIEELKLAPTFVDIPFNFNTQEMSKFFSSNKSSALIISFPEVIFPDKPIDSMQNPTMLISLLNTINSKSFINSNNMLILLTDSKYSINKQILSSNSRSSLIEVDYPNYSQRLNFIKHLNKTSKKAIKKEINDEEFARITAGLTLVSMEDIYLQGEYTGELKRKFITERKNELIMKEYGEVLEVLNSDGYSFKDFAGQEHLKKYHKEVVIDPMKEGLTDIVPKGLLYTGPPGTGKTHFARCLSGEAGINFVELKMSKILDKWVGESEKKFDKALTCIKSIAPVGVFIDEIDQAFSRGEDHGNPVAKNLFGMFLTVLSDPKNRGKIVWIGACNYPNHLDEALKRTGRFDKKIPFLPPKEKDIIEIFKVHLNKAKQTNYLKEEELGFLAKETKGYTPAEIEGIVNKASEIAIRKKKKEIKFEDIKKAIETIPRAESDKIKEMINLAIKECNDREFIEQGPI